MTQLTQTRLKELLFYNPETGNFTWLVRSADRIKIGQTAGCLDKTNGYISIKVDKRRYTGHRLAYLYMTGEFPTEIDHINRNRADNRWENLRNVPHSINMKNRPKFVWKNRNL